MTRRFFSGIALTAALLVAGVGAMHAQNTPEPPAPPEPGEEQLFLFNDGTAHLGVNLGDVTAEKAQELKLPAVSGAIVESVQRDSAAAKAGIKVGDVITEFDGERVRSSAELRRLIRETPAGRTVAIQILRDGKTSVLSAKLEASSKNLNIYIPEIHVPPNMDLSEGPFAFAFHGATLGIAADNLTPQLAEYFQVKQGSGVLISEVTKGGSADKAGLKAGDIIVQLDGKPINDVEELRMALNENFTRDTRKVNLTIVRDHHQQTVTAELTRSHRMGNRTSKAEPDLEQKQAQRSQAEQQRAADLARAIAVLRSQADQVSAQATQLRALESERAGVRAEELKQLQQTQAEWQRQLQEQMRALKDQLKQMQDLRLVQQDGEI
jgi:membrane-associated protease RseP (regulator of RpoE activity)